MIRGDGGSSGAARRMMTWITCLSLILAALPDLATVMLVQAGEEEAMLADRDGGESEF